MAGFAGGKWRVAWKREGKARRKKVADCYDYVLTLYKRRPARGKNRTEIIRGSRLPELQKKDKIRRDVEETRVRGGGQ